MININIFNLIIKGFILSILIDIFFSIKSNFYYIIPLNSIGFYKTFGNYNKNILKSGFHFKWWWTTITVLKLLNHYSFNINFETSDNILLKNFKINLYFNTDENIFKNVINDVNIIDPDINNKLENLIKSECLDILINNKFSSIKHNFSVKENLLLRLNKKFKENYGVIFTDIVYEINYRH